MGFKEGLEAGASDVKKMVTQAGGQCFMGVGKSEDGAAELEIELGVKPRYIRVVIPKAGTDGEVYEWFEGMDDESAIKYFEDSGYKVNMIDSNGITVDSRGFKLGTAAQKDDSEFAWLAIG